MEKKIEYSDFYIENCEYKDAVVAKDFYMSESNLPFMACTYRWPGAQLHWHHYWEILCQIEGKTKIKVGNEEFLSEEGDITIIGSDELHSTRKMTPEHCLLILQFRGSVLLPYLKEIEQFKYLSNIIFEQMGNKQHFRIQNNYYIRGLLERTLKEYREKQFGYEIQIQAYLMQMFAFFLRNKYICIPQLDPEKVSALEKVKNSLIYMENNYNKPMELHEVAAQSCISIYNFCRMFKAATEHTFVEYLNYIRIKESEKLLLFSEDSVGKIAMDTGFSSLSYFNRVFKRKNGVSPLVYRKQNCTKNKQDKNSNGREHFI
ncbi:MAG: helix-turn-helix transcriptional regulator [Clostridiales bacterium]|nr:helix-turn-helix transcriptional regulator [Clostridiales bacterium]